MKTLLLIIIPFLSFGQGWEQTFGGVASESGESVKQTTDGGYIVCGSTSSFGEGPSDIYVVKTNSNGDVLWTESFGGFGPVGDSGTSIEQTTDGGYIITGSVNAPTVGSEFQTTANICLLKIDSLGAEEWLQEFDEKGGADYGCSVQQTTDGGYIVTGFTNSSNDMCVIKTDQYGEEEWSQVFVSENGGRSIDETSDGGYIITGDLGDGLGNNNVYLLKINVSGEAEWSQVFSEDGYSGIGDSVQQTSDEGYIVCGTLYGSDDGFWNLYLVKTDTLGELLWSQTFEGSDGCSVGRSVQQTLDGGYIVCGSTECFSAEESDVYLMKLDEDGTEEWSQTFGGTGVDVGVSVQQTTDGGYIITGTTHSFGNGDGDVWLIKTDSEGNITNTSTIELATQSKHLINKVNILGKENNTKKGLQLHIYDDGSVEKKYLVK